jgi:hypothetical protein
MSASHDPTSRSETGTSVLSAIGGTPLVELGRACLVAAEQLLRDRHSGQTIVIVIADSGMKYLSTDLWAPA